MDNRKPLPIGVDSFKRLREQGYRYVDKSMLVRQLLDQRCTVGLFLRPRRFGKTLALSMLQTFFEHTGEDPARYFEGLSIMESGQYYRSFMGRYPVVFLSLKDTRVISWELAQGLLFQQIAKEYNRHLHLVVGSSKVAVEDQLKYERIASLQASVEMMYTSLEFLTTCLHKATGTPTIVLIDEYDVPLENAWSQGFYDQATSFLRTFLGSALKTNPSLAFAVLTGCLRIAKESIFTGLNNLYVNTVLDSAYDECYGFLAHEVQDLFAEYGLAEAVPEALQWYDGYRFGKQQVSNPWSIMCHLEALRHDVHQVPGNHWANTSGNVILRSLLEQADARTRSEIETLVQGGAVTKRIMDCVTYGDLDRIDESIYSVLLLTGYLTVGEPLAIDRSTQVRIPNHEVREVFADHILHWMDRHVYLQNSDQFIQVFLEGDGEAMQRLLQQRLQLSISTFDSSEAFYHGFMTGLLQHLETGCSVLSNREAGDGRADLAVLCPHRALAVVAEFKTSPSALPAVLCAKAGEALAQILDRSYAREYLQQGYQRVVCHGIAFKGKYCAVASSIEQAGQA